MSKYSSLQNGSDIRGVAIQGYGDEVNLTQDSVSAIAYNFMCFLRAKYQRQDLVIAIGRDPRLSGEDLLDKLSKEFINLGVKVLDCGLASTPAMFMATKFNEIAAHGSIMITASHLPKHRNGFKFFTVDGGLNKEDIKYILSDIDKKDIAQKKGEIIKCHELMELYQKHLRDLIFNELGSNQPLSNLKIIVNCGNGSGGFFVKEVLEPLGADISDSQFIDPDGNFPNHIPNPENKEALAAIVNHVNKKGCDLGIIFDTDVDRCVAVDEMGNPIAKNSIVALASKLVANMSGQTIVTDSVANKLLSKFLKDELNIDHFIYRRGYKNVIDKAIELNSKGIDCPLAIETSGHCAFRENFFLDDGAYLALKIVIETAKLKSRGIGLSTLLSKLEQYKYSFERRIPANDNQKLLRDIENILDNSSGLVKVDSFEGIRYDFNSGWFLLRSSLHDPNIVFNIEGDNIKDIQYVDGLIRKVIDF